MVKTEKVIFLDIDGVMIPQRAALFLPQETSGTVSNFDPIATNMINSLIEKSNAKIVLTSTWRKKGYMTCIGLLQMNGIDPKHLHIDWRTDICNDTRTGQIETWLRRNPQVTHHVVYDDEHIGGFGLDVIRVSMNNGIGVQDYFDGLACLGIEHDWR